MNKKDVFNRLIFISGEKPCSQTFEVIRTLKTKKQDFNGEIPFLFP